MELQLHSVKPLLYDVNNEVTQQRAKVANHIVFEEVILLVASQRKCLGFCHLLFWWMNKTKLMESCSNEILVHINL